MQPLPVDKDSAPTRPRWSELAILSFAYGLVAALSFVSIIVLPLNGGHAEAAFLVLVGLACLCMLPAIGWGIGGVVETSCKPHLRGRVCATIGLVLGVAVALFVFFASSQYEGLF